MAEPATSTVGITLAAGAITLTGSILGLQYDHLMAGMFGGLVALSMADPTTKWRMTSSVAISALMAGYTTPVLVAFGHNFAIWTSTVAEGSFSLFCAVAAGVSSHTAVPSFLAFIKRFIGAKK